MRGDGAEEVRCEKRWGGGSEENRTELPRRGTKGRGGAVRPLREKHTRVSRRKKSRFFCQFSRAFCLVGGSTNAPAGHPQSAEDEAGTTAHQGDFACVTADL